MNIFPFIAVIAPYVVALLPFAAFAVSYALQRPDYGARKNGAISAGSILIAAFLSAFLSGKLTGSVVDDTAYVLTMATAIQAETFRPLQGYLRGDPPAKDVQDGS